MSDTFQDKNILVTGATGLLGSWIVKDLFEKKANVISIVRDYVPNSLFFLDGADKRSIIVNGRIEDYKLVERVLNEHEIDYVLHLGAQTIVRTANRSPLSTFESNIKGTWSVLEACRVHKENIKSIVVASSDKSYGDQPKLPYSEEMPLLGIHPYDVSKSCTDMISLSYARTYSMPISITRCGNIFGGGDLNFSRIIPGTLRSLHQNQRPVIRSDESYVRDYIYVKDIVDGYLKLLQKTEEQKLAGEAFNFSYEKPLSVIEIVDLILRLTKKEKLKPIIKNEASNEIKKQYLSSKKVRERIGWKPKYDLEQGLVETIDWYNEFFRRLSV